MSEEKQKINKLRHRNECRRGKKGVGLFVFICSKHMTHDTVSNESTRFYAVGVGVGGVGGGGDRNGGVRTTNMRIVFQQCVSYRSRCERTNEQMNE